MSRDVAVTVDGVSKKFAKRLQRSMLYGVQDVVRDLLKLPTGSDRLRRDEFWALQDVSFQLQRGETLAIVGPNGSGKSTLLKMLNGIFRPDKGRIHIRGRVGALIEVGAGFHPMLSGRENIYVNGAILGMSKAEIKRKFDSIVDFAELKDFIDVPVKNYSSGMYVRLGFAVAAHCEPDVLLVDEVLSVGDIAFQQKCFRYFEEEVLNKGVTLILVSHSIYAIARMCSKGLLLNNGKLLYQGDVVGLTSKFFETMRKRTGAAGAPQSDWDLRPGAGEIRLEELYLRNGSGNRVDSLKSGEGVEACLELHASRDFNHVPSLVLKIVDQANTLMAVTQPPLGLRATAKVFRGRNTVTCRLDSINLMPGTYTLHVKIGGGTDLLQDNALNAGTIELVGDDSLYLSCEGAGLVYLPSVWRFEA